MKKNYIGNKHNYIQNDDTTKNEKYPFEYENNENHKKINDENTKFINTQQIE